MQIYDLADGDSDITFAFTCGATPHSFRSSMYGELGGLLACEAISCGKNIGVLNHALIARAVL